eukprot:2909051-Amphidinium_carterae.1
MPERVNHGAVHEHNQTYQKRRNNEFKRYNTIFKTVLSVELLLVGGQGWKQLWHSPALPKQSDGSAVAARDG